MKKLILSLTLLLPIVVFSQNRYVVTNALNFRNAASLNSNIIEVLQYKDTLKVLEELNKWVLVEHDDNIGYVWIAHTASDYDIIEYSEETITIGAICNDGTIQNRISSKTCQYRGGVKKWLYETHVYRNGKKLFIINTP